METAKADGFQRFSNQATKCDWTPIAILEKGREPYKHFYCRSTYCPEAICGPQLCGMPSPPMAGPCVPLETFSEPVQERIAYFRDPKNWFRGNSAQKAWCYVVDENNGIGTKIPMLTHPNIYTYSPYLTKPAYLPRLDYTLSSTDPRLDKLLSYIKKYTTPSMIYQHPEDIVRTTQKPREQNDHPLRADFQDYRLLSIYAFIYILK